MCVLHAAIVPLLLKCCLVSFTGIHFDLFDQSKLGVPLFIMGLAYMLVFAPALLPAELLPPEVCALLLPPRTQRHLRFC